MNTNPEWKLVPVEPTSDMWAPLNKLDDQMAAGGYDGKRASIEQAWNCLVETAPEGPPLTFVLGPDPRGVSVGVYQGSSCVYNGAPPIPTGATGEDERAALFGDEAHVLVPVGLIGAACSAIDKKRDAPKTLAELRRYTFGDLSAHVPAPAAGDALDALVNNLAGMAYPYAVTLDQATRDADSDELEGIARRITGNLKDKMRAALAVIAQQKGEA